MLSLQKQLRRFYFRRKKETFGCYNKWMADQSLSLEDLQQKQLDRLNELLTHAYNNVPYYRKLLSDSSPSNGSQIILNSLSDLNKIPFLTKEIINENQDDLLANDHLQRKSYGNTSGGSTGVPVEVTQDERYLISDESCLLMVKNWRGVDPFDSEIIIWGAERDTFEGKKPLSSYLGDFLRNRMILNCFRMDSADIENYIKLINKHKPKMIRAYVDAAYEIARYAKENNIKIEKQNIVHTGAGNLYDYMRQEIEKSFGCRVFNHYGGREAGSIASECSTHDGMHIMMEHNLVEIIDPYGNACPDGEEGEIVITNLNNFSMPLIRYRVGDMGIMKKYEPCSCGCNYPKLAEVSGRITDVIVNRQGRRISPAFFIHLIGVVCNQGNVGKFQVVQNSLDKITVKIVEKKNLDKYILDDIKNKIVDIMGGSCLVEFEFVEDIEPTKTGKYRSIISEINNKAGNIS